MCGFVGCFGEVDERVKNTKNLIFHRGPDQQKFFKGDNWSIQFNRLSIIDLSEDAMQPFTHKDITIFINGEIYNYIELRDRYSKEFRCKTSSDVEILPFLYKKYGLDFLNLINGMFSLVIIDKNKNKFFMVRDRFGKKPLFYFLQKDKLYFSSEIKGLENFINLKINKDNLALNLIANLNIEPLTVFEDIESVLPGFAYEYNNKKIYKIRWYKPKIQKLNENYDLIEKKFYELSNSSINYRLRSDVPIGIFLSGGLDSNHILNIANKNYKNLLALICEIPGKEKMSNNNTDVVNQEKICKQINCKYKKITLDFNFLNKNLMKMISDYDVPIPGTGHFMFNALSEEAKKNNLKVILIGGGGDEISGGYPWQNKLNYVPNFFYRNNNMFLNFLRFILQKVFHNKNFFTMKIFKFLQLFLDPAVYHVESHGSNASFFMKDVYFNIQKKIRNTYSQYLKLSESTFNFSDKNTVDFRNIFITLASQNYFFDQSTMINSIENRSPLLDYRLVEFMLSIPETKKNKKGLRYLYKKMLSKNLPKFIINSNKSGPNLPIAHWIKTQEDLERKIKNYLVQNISYVKRYLSNDLASNLTNGIIEKSDNKFILRFRLVCIILWIKIKIEKKTYDKKISFVEAICE